MLRILGWEPIFSSLPNPGNYWAYCPISHEFEMGKQLSQLPMTFPQGKSWRFWVKANEFAFHSVVCGHMTHAPLNTDFSISNQRFYPLIADYINALIREFIIPRHLHWSSNGILRSLVGGWVVRVFTAHPVLIVFHDQHWIVYHDSCWSCSKYYKTNSNSFL